MVEPSIKYRVLEMVAAMNRGDLHHLCQAAAPGLIIRDGHTGLPSGREGLRLRLGSLEMAIPDLTLAVESVTVAEDVALVTLTGTGTHLGELFGVTGTGQRVSFRTAVQTRWATGLLAELQSTCYIEEA